MKEIEQLAHTAGETYEYLRKYIKNEFELLQLRTYGRISRSIGMLYYRASLAVIFLLGFVFLSITIGLLLGQILNSNVKGFGIVTGFFFLVLLILILFKNKLKRMFGSEILSAINDESNGNEE